MTIEAVKMCVDSIVLVPASFLDSLYCSHFRLQQTVLNVSYRKGPSQKLSEPDNKNDIISRTYLQPARAQTFN